MVIMSFLGQILGNETRARILSLFVGSEVDEMTKADVAARSGTSPVAAAKELRALESLGVIKQVKGGAPSSGKGETRWVFNRHFQHARALSMFVHQVSPQELTGMEKGLKSSGRVSAVILSGVFVGDPTRPADVVIAGDAMNERRIEKVLKSLEPRFGREIRYAVLSTPEFRYRLTIQDRLLRDILDFPHRILVNRSGILS